MTTAPTEHPFLIACGSLWVWVILFAPCLFSTRGALVHAVTPLCKVPSLKFFWFALSRAQSAACQTLMEICVTITEYSGNHCRYWRDESNSDGIHPEVRGVDYSFFMSPEPKRSAWSVLGIRGLFFQVKEILSKPKWFVLAAVCSPDEILLSDSC